ncbi:MAG: DUF4296 domain-containing protein [Gemmatimonadaceae bacterium]|nr:DUF4296 domain-containing protein [Chitinophagaceae bacterium]
MIKYFLSALIIFAVSCTNDKKVPDDVIPPAKMEKIMWQLLQSDDFVGIYVGRDSSLDLTKERLIRYRQIFDLNKTTREAFQRSYKFYTAHPDISKVMFDSIGARATRERTEEFKPRDTTLQKKKDSIPVTN